MSVYRFLHPTLGMVTATGRPGSHKLSARWVNEELHINIPKGVSPADIKKAVEHNLAEFEAIKPKPRYEIGQRIDCHNFTIDITEAPAGQTKPDIFLNSDNSSQPKFIITIPHIAPVATPRTQQAIARCIHLAARHVAPKVLLPKAQSIAANLGLYVNKWEISYGKTTLGCCFTRQRRIRLSYMCVFLDPELRDYIICHELAHLTEPGHTKAFHTLCDRYCSGHERSLVRRLRQFPWPVDR